jgi:DNA modification methylase
VCAGLDRRFVLVDSAPEAVAVMVERLGNGDSKRDTVAS